MTAEATTTQQASPTGVLARYAAETTFADLPITVVEGAKRYVVDSLANAIAGAGLEPGRMVIELFAEMGGVEEATILATGRRLPVASAAYVNAFLSNVLDFDDTHDSVGHPGCTAIPPVLAVAEKLHRSGQELLTAIVVAYETSLRIALAIKATPERYKTVFGLSTWQIFGTAAGAANLMRLDAEKARHAFGLAGTSAPVPHCRKIGLELAERPFAWSKNNYGWASMGGVLGAQLAAKGFLANRFMLDGERGFWVMAGSDRCDFDRMTSGLGEEFLMLETSFKPYASCRWTHATLDAVTEIVEKHAPRAADVRKIRVRSFYETARSLATRRPESVIDAQFAIPFLSALVILGRSPAKGLSDRDLTDPAVHALADTVEIEIDEDADRAFFGHGQYWATVEIEMASGARYAARCTSPKGSPRNPVTAAETTEKFLQLVVPVLGDARARRILADVERLEKLDDMGLAVGGWMA